MGGGVVRCHDIWAQGLVCGYLSIQCRGLSSLIGGRAGDWFRLLLVCLLARRRPGAETDRSPSEGGAPHLLLGNRTFLPGSQARLEEGVGVWKGCGGGEAVP